MIQVDTALDILAHGFSCAGHQIQIQKSLLVQLIHDGIDTAGFVKVLHVGGTCGCQMAEVGSPVGNFVGDFHVDLHTCLVGDGGKMQHGVGGASESHVHGEGVHEGVLCHDVSGTDIFFNELHDLHAGVLGQADTGGVDRGDRSVALQAHADGLGQTVHGVGCVHTGAGAAGGAHLLFILAELLFCHCSGSYRTDCLEDGGQAALSAVDPAGQHGTAGYKDGGNIDPGSCHQKSGDVLVTVGNHDEAVKTVGFSHALRGIRDQITGDEGIFHADMSHGDTVADSNRGEHDGHSACHCDTHLDRLGNFVQVHVSGDDLIIGTYDTDHRASSLFLGVAEGVEKAAMGGC